MKITLHPGRLADGWIDPREVGDRVLPATFQLEMQRENGTPDLFLNFEVRDGVPQCRRAELRSTEEGREVLSSDLRGVRLEDLLELAVVQAAIAVVGPEEGRPVGALRMITTQEERRQTLSQTRTIRRGARRRVTEARRRVTEDLLREVAQVYRDNIDSNPTAAVQRHTGRAHRTAALYVQQAREAGFLGASIRGKAGEQS